MNSEKFLYQPTQYIELEIKKPIIFLAGPIQGTDDWQTKAYKIINTNNPEIIVASPRRDYLPGTFDYNEQVDWETFHLNRASANGAILFWLAAETIHNHERSYAQTTRFELAEWKERHLTRGTKLVIGIEGNFSGGKYIRKRFNEDCPDVPILNNLEDTCNAAIGVLNSAPLAS